MSTEKEHFHFATPETAIVGDFLLIRSGFSKIASPKKVVKATEKSLWLESWATPIRRANSRCGDIRLDCVIGTDEEIHHVWKIEVARRNLRATLDGINNFYNTRERDIKLEEPALFAALDLARKLHSMLTVGK
jgi:hypothetical protein